jgi:hypothetical protein
MTTLSVSLNSSTVLPQSRDCSYHVNRRPLAPPSLWLQKHTDLGAHNFALPNCDITLDRLKLLAPDVGDFLELIPMYTKCGAPDFGTVRKWPGISRCDDCLPAREISGLLSPSVRLGASVSRLISLRLFEDALDMVKTQVSVCLYVRIWRGGEPSRVQG